MTVTRISRFLLLFGFLGLTLIAFGADAPPPTREQARRLMNQGNLREAHDAFRKLALDPEADPKEAAMNIGDAIGTLQRLGRIDEADQLLEAFIAAQGDHWRTLRAAAKQYDSLPNHGFMIAGVFQRGPHRGGGEYYNSQARDRSRALQLMVQAMPMVEKETDAHAAARFYLDLADILMTEGEAWRLQSLTPIDVLPDYEPGYHYGYSDQGAPVDAEGEPIYYDVPKSWDDAANDGQRWRWALAQAAERDSAVLSETLWRRAQFCESQFGVQTLAEYRILFTRGGDDEDRAHGIRALHTLDDDETIAKLASGVKRFKLPDEHNHIKLYQTLAEKNEGYSDLALGKLVENFIARRQFPRAAEYLRTRIKRGAGVDAKQLLSQIVDPWGRFEPTETQPADKGANIAYRYRNGKSVRFTAKEIDVEQLLADVQEYLKSRPGQLEHDKLNIEDIGYRLVVKQQKKYVGKQVAEWSFKLDPPENHFDRRINVATPLTKAGAYLVTAGIEGGEESHIVVWVADTAIIQKPLGDKTFYYVADAVTGEPIERAKVEFFGFRQVHENRNNYRIDTKNFAEFTDTNGAALLSQTDENQNFQWLVTARTDKGRLAYLGFHNVWFRAPTPGRADQLKAFVITDRPVYRPGQTMHFKAWVRRANYDLQRAAADAGATYVVEIRNPKGDKVYEKSLKTDEYGGVAADFELPSDATLGQYYVQVVGVGGANFRVEEYKKPEFEVTVEAPEKPAKLGDTITATVKARYYFGAPVTEARVKYKVLRSSHDATWYPPTPWDWFYGPGYWWFGGEYSWYPGWSRWGCVAPRPSWIWRRDPPEVVASAEVPIGPDGEIKIEIDTSLAKELHPNDDHSYQVVAEVTDLSRRTIVGQGNVIAARDPFKVFVWVDGGYYRAGDTIQAHGAARTPDGNPIAGSGELKLFKIRYDDEGHPHETLVESWEVKTGDDGRVSQRMVAADAGQYRLSFKLTSDEGDAIEGAYIFTVIGQGATAANYRFEHLELIPDKKHYSTGDKVRLLIQTNRTDSVVLLFLRPTDGVYSLPKLVRLDGKTTVHEIDVETADMPNFFVEAVTISDGQAHTVAREIAVPPQKRILNVKLEPSKREYLPGEKGEVKLTLTDIDGKPFVGSTVLTIYDKSLEYISGGPNTADIREFFWKWRRTHFPRTQSSLDRASRQHVAPGAKEMADLGPFGDVVEGRFMVGAPINGGDVGGGVAQMRSPVPAAAPMAEAADAMLKSDGGPGESAAENLVTPTIRSEFADVVVWKADLVTDGDGVATVPFDMPENLTTWKIKTWAMGPHAQVGEAAEEVITRKNIVVRAQTPRFLIERDEVILSANVHNYLKSAKHVRVVLELEGSPLEMLDESTRTVEIDAGGEVRVDWRVRATAVGEAVVRMKALTDEESDAVEVKFPVEVHGILKTDSYAGSLRPGDVRGEFTITVPERRRPDQTRLEIRFSPTLAGSMVDALPYLANYPYGCTEQTLNRFLPSVITQRVLLDMGLNLKDIKDKRTNLNAQQIGDPAERAKQWKQYERNPVFDEEELRGMVREGVEALVEMQLSDGGWGWFSGYGERSSAHLTALVVHGLLIAQSNDVAVPAGVLDRGVAWLKSHQSAELQKLRNAEKKTEPYKLYADEIDALVNMVLTERDQNDPAMADVLYRDRDRLSVYAKAMLGLAFEKTKDQERLAMILRNIDQYVVEDDENQTAWLRLPNESYWWFWYGDEIEAMSYYLKLLARTDPQGQRAARLAKYLVNNRKNGAYWKSTRDTAIAIEALAEFLKASGEGAPELTVEIWVDGQKRHGVEVTKDNLFTFDNALIIEGDDLDVGEHTIEIRKSGKGPLYYNGYLTVFTLEDEIPASGLEIKVTRKAYRLKPVDKTIQVQGGRGQAIDQRVEKYERELLDDDSILASGDLVEIELEIESKNDYEYLLFESKKAAGFEPVDVRSGYGGGGLGAYIEYRDDRVALFVRSLARGRHSISYRVRAEIPGDFSALPAIASAMYAPELRGNSEKMRVHIRDDAPSEH